MFCNAFLSLEGNIKTVLVSLWFLVGLVLTAWPITALMLKRMHDRNRSGCWCLVALIPIVGLWVAIEILLPGSRGRNNYGPQP